jgi:hypothetical protein
MTLFEIGNTCAGEVVDTTMAMAQPNPQDQERHQLSVSGLLRNLQFEPLRRYRPIK